MSGDKERLASPRREWRLSRRVLLAGTAGAAAALAFGDQAGAQTAPQTVPDDPTKVPGSPVAPVGTRSPFEHPTRLVPAPVPAFTPLDLLNGIITPSDLHYVIARGGIPAIDPARYQLLIHGMVDRPSGFSLDDLSVSHRSVGSCSSSAPGIHVMHGKVRNQNRRCSSSRAGPAPASGPVYRSPRC
jgi:sulfane dehydrogenase subunit SoxC